MTREEFRECFGPQAFATESICRETLTDVLHRCHNLNNIPVEKGQEERQNMIVWIAEILEEIDAPSCYSLLTCD